MSLRVVCSILGQAVHSTQKSKASAEAWGLQSRLASALSIFFFSLITALRVGQPHAEVPHRPGCGVRLTAPAGVFLPKITSGDISGDEGQLVGVDQHERQLPDASTIL